MENDRLTSQQAADILGVTIQWVVRLVKDGQLKGQKFGRDWQIQRASVEAYAAAHRKRGNDATN